MTVAWGKAHVFGIERGWLTGPIFDKELRVASRRRRNYALRLLYILLLTLFLALVWLSVAEYEGNAAFQQSRMAFAGKQVIVTIVLFQFIATQLLAIVMLSTSISDEVYHRTLGLLMTTPINSLQIVMGKVLSKLLQLVLLLGISLPILAIIRVFGGVSWEYLLSGLSITLTAAIFSGSMSLYFSINNRRAYTVIIRTIFVLGTLYFFIPMAVAAVWHFVLPEIGISPSSQSRLPWLGLLLLSHLNPVFAIAATTRDVLSPTGSAVYWPVHCMVMLGLSALVLGRAVTVVRRVALRQVTGQLDPFHKNGRKKSRATPHNAPTGGEIDGPVKRVLGPPVVWRELRAPFIQGVDSRNSRIGMAVTVIALLLTYVASAAQGYLDEDFTHISYALLFILMGLIFNAVFSATRITTEKESQTWPLLLATPMSDWDILLGKAVSAFRRCLPIWILLAGHLALFVPLRYIHPIAIVHMAIVVAWLTCFVTGAGLYFSTRLGRTTSAVVANFALLLGLWVVGPIVAGFLAIIDRSQKVLTSYMWTHPVFQAELLMSGTAGTRNASQTLHALEYGQEHVIFGGQGGLTAGELTIVLLMVGSLYGLAGLLFLWRAKCHLRRRVF